jgi:hypothetical protein
MRRAGNASVISQVQISSVKEVSAASGLLGLTPERVLDVVREEVPNRSACAQNG